MNMWRFPLCNKVGGDQMKAMSERPSQGRLKRSAFGICAFLQILAAPLALAAAPDASYSQVGRIAAHASLWDLATIDSTTGRLYLATDGVMALDLATQQVTPQLVPGKMTHGIALLGNGQLAVADASAHTVTLFDGVTGKITATVATGQPREVKGWHNPDALVWEPKSGLLVVVNGDSGALALVDLKTSKVVGTIPIGGKLEFADVDGNGNVFVNIETKNSIAVVDIAQRKVTRVFKLKGCEGPTGLAYDANDRLVMSVCANGVAKFIDAETAVELASPGVGKGADAILFDPNRHVAFSTGGDEGTVSVIAVRNAHDIRVVQTLKTRWGARLAALDRSTGKLYVPTVEYDKSLPPVHMPGIPSFPAAKADSFEFWVFAPDR
jgi:DNA-binding beta-propeller fold protein YncE